MAKALARRRTAGRRVWSRFMPPPRWFSRPLWFCPYFRRLAIEKYIEEYAESGVLLRRFTMPISASKAPEYLLPAKMPSWSLPSSASLRVLGGTTSSSLIRKLHDCAISSQACLSCSFWALSAIRRHISALARYSAALFTCRGRRKLALLSVSSGIPIVKGQPHRNERRAPSAEANAAWGSRQSAGGAGGRAASWRSKHVPSIDSTRLRD